MAVFGCGGVGLGAIQAARIAGATRVIALDIEEHRLAAATALGATDAIDATRNQPIDAVIAATGGGGVDRSIEAVGLPETATQAFSVLQPGGHTTILGMMPPDTDIPIPGRLLRHGRSLGGTIMGDVRTRADIVVLRSPELQALLEAVHGNSAAMDAFTRVYAGVTSAAEFFSDENVARIFATAAEKQAAH